MKKVLCGVITVVLMVAMLCGCSSSKLPKGIYVKHWAAFGENPGGYVSGHEYTESVYVYCIFSDGKVSDHIVRNYYSDASDGIFRSTTELLSEVEQDNFYDDFKYKNGKLINQGSNDRIDYCLKISDDPTEFDSIMDEHKVFDEIVSRL